MLRRILSPPDLTRANRSKKAHFSRRRGSAMPVHREQVPFQTCLFCHFRKDAIQPFSNSSILIDSYTVLVQPDQKGGAVGTAPIGNHIDASSPPSVVRRSAVCVEMGLPVARVQVGILDGISAVQHHPVAHIDTHMGHAAGITSFRRSGKVFILGEKAASVPPGHPGGENLWAVAFRVIVGEKIRDF